MFKYLVSIFLLLVTLGLANEKPIQQAQPNEQLAELNQKLHDVDNELQKNLMYKRYGSYLTYKNISRDLEQLESELKQ
ncbi:MAG: hypothetical protein WHU93_07465 [Arcobacteraceae bacterium]